jgi:hypothetical protein
VIVRSLVVIALWLAVSIGSARAEEQGLIVHFRYGSTNLSRLFELEDKIRHQITRSHVGEFDGDEIANDGSDGYLYMYGPSADRLFDVVVPILKPAAFMQGAEVMRRYGPPGDATRKVTVTIGPDKP